MNPSLVVTFTRYSSVWTSSQGSGFEAFQDVGADRTLTARTPPRKQKPRSKSHKQNLKSSDDPGGPPSRSLREVRRVRDAHPHDAEQAGGSAPQGSNVLVDLDPESHLPVRLRYTWAVRDPIRIPTGESRATVVAIVDYQTIGGVRIPHKLTRSFDGVFQQEVQYNSGADKPRLAAIDVQGWRQLTASYSVQHRKPRPARLRREVPHQHS
jgi:hypothetical protein